MEQQLAFIASFINASEVFFVCIYGKSMWLYKTEAGHKQIPW